ncbi:MAG: acyltransferase [Rhizobium sp.]|nr:MAG: acyltransferase [Rhizobium sp.]
MSGRLDGIQILRFVAAAMVLIQHAVFLPSLNYGIDVMAFRRLSIGSAGVYVFFVISGYVIAGLVHQHPVKFALHRAARIYPPYLASMLIAGILLTSLGGIDASKVRWLWSFTLFPVGGAIDSWANVPFWTLIYEMTFYITTAALMIGGSRSFDIGLVVWSAAIAIAAFLLPPQPSLTASYLAILINPLSLLFIAGAALNRLHSGSTWPAALVALIALSAFWRQATPFQNLTVFAVGTVAAVHLAVVVSPVIRRARWLSPLVKGGDFSYGLYLLHAPIIAALLLAGLPKIVSYPWAVVACLAGGGVVGLLFGYFEFRFYRAARSSIDGLVQNLDGEAEAGNVSSTGRSVLP